MRGFWMIAMAAALVGCGYAPSLFAEGSDVKPMANTLPDAEHQASLDENLPYIEQGAEPPGRWVPDALIPGAQKWDGQTLWSTRHGDAVVRWSLGCPVRIDFASYPDRTRGVVIENGYGRWRRLAVNGRNWVHGTIEIKVDDVTFSDGEQPIYTPPQKTAIPNLEADVAHDAGFLDALQDDDFANAAYTVLKTQRFYKGELRGWKAGSGRAAELVANLRGLGESFSDWKPYGGSRDESYLRSVHEHLARIGWRIETLEDQQRMEQLRVSRIPLVLREMNELGKRRESTAGEWTEKLKQIPLAAPDAQAHQAAELLRALALSGRISEEEHDIFFNRLELPFGP
jgi:hypothetical protein